MVELTARQREVAELVALGYTTKRIAAVLGISTRRVQRLIASVAEQVRAQSDRDERVQIALWWTLEHRRASYSHSE